MTHNEKVLALLSDGQPHTHRELYGLYVVAHSRVADLRKQGHTIAAWRDGDTYLYQLQDPVADETSTPLDTAPATGNTPSRGSASGDPSPSYNPDAFADGESHAQEPLLGQLRLVRS